MKIPKSIMAVFWFAALLLLPLGSASGEEVLRMLVWEGYAPDEQVARFEKIVYEKYNRPVRLKVSFISDPNGFFDAVRGKEADIISPTHNLIKDKRFDLIDKKLILPIDLKNIPNYENIIPSLQRENYITEGGNVYGVPFVHGPYGLAYNTKHMNAPESWDVLWDPKYAGRYTISADYYEVNIYIAALALGLRGVNIHTDEALNTPEFKEKLNYLAQNARSLWTGVDKADDLDGLSLAAVWGFSFPELEKRGKIWKFAEPKEGTMGWVDNFVIANSLREKPFLRRVAEEWLNFVLSPEFQVEAVVRGLGSSPVNLSVRDLLTPEEVGRFHLNDPDYFKNNRILWPTVNSTRDRNRMKLLWDDAMEKRWGSGSNKLHKIGKSQP